MNATCKRTFFVKPLSSRLWPFLATLLIWLSGCQSSAGEFGKGGPSRIWSDIFDGWDVEPLCGTDSSPLPPAYFQQGPRMESGGGGGPGALAVAKDGTKFVSIGMAVYRITPHGRVELLAGTPGLAGYRDGPADKALFNGISVVALGPKGELLLLEQANRCLRSVVPQQTGMWQVKTLVGSPAKKKERRDGGDGEGSFEQPCGMTVFDDGSIFFMDNNYLRLFKDGKLTTVNAEGGNGFADGPLVSARFRIAFTNNCLTSDGRNVLYIADMWNNVLRKIDWEKQEISTVAGGPIRSDPKAVALRQGRDPFQDGQGMEAFFHPGGGITTVWCDRHTNHVYITVADDPHPHVYTPDGWVRSLRVDVPIASEDDGRVYITGQTGIRVLRKLQPGEKPFLPEGPPPGDGALFKQAPFDPKSIPADVARIVVARPLKPPLVDGKLDDECWQKAQSFRLTTLNGHEAPKETATDIHLTADEENFYIAVKCLEPNMDLMKQPNRHRDDDNFYTDDYVEVFLIPGLDPRGNVFQLMINCAGTTWEAKDRKSDAWNPNVKVKTSREAGSWTVEIALPFSEISAEAKHAQWRLNVGRSRPARGEDPAHEASWSVLNSNSSHVYQRFNVVAMESLDGKLP